MKCSESCTYHLVVILWKSKGILQHSEGSLGLLTPSFQQETMDETSSSLSRISFNPPPAFITLVTVVSENNLKRWKRPGLDQNNTMFAKFTPRLISTCYTAAVTACYQRTLRFELWLEDFRQNIIFSVDPQFPPAQPQRKKRWRIHNRRKQERRKQTEIKLVNEMILAAFARPQTPTPSLPP